MIRIWNYQDEISNWKWPSLRSSACKTEMLWWFCMNIWKIWKNCMEIVMRGSHRVQGFVCCIQIQIFYNWNSSFYTCFVLVCYECKSNKVSFLGIWIDVVGNEWKKKIFECSITVHFVCDIRVFTPSPGLLKYCKMFEIYSNTTCKYL